ncbi:MAG: putative prokaryotic signal transducing protein [Verrucomicrobiota bacterium]|jgi:hypothetical protein
MLMLRTYFNLSEAGLVKSFLDDHEIFCLLFDENAHVVRAPFAIPVRLVVSDSQSEQAAKILDAARFIPKGGNIMTVPQYLEAVGQLDHEAVPEQRAVEEARGNNPWEILAIAYLFLVPGLGFFLEKSPLVLIATRAHWGRGLRIALSIFEVHLVGALLITAALLITLCYFHVRRAIARDIGRNS